LTEWKGTKEARKWCCLLNAYIYMLLEGVGSFRLIKNKEGSIERLRDQNLVNTVAGFCIV